jgi:hypothetical protein
MKKYLIFAVMFAVAMASAAEKFFEMDKKGNLLFKKATLFNFTPGGFERFGGYAFNGNSSLEMELDAKDYKNNALSVSVTGCVSALPGPEGGVLFYRPGYHNILGIDRQGRITLSIWYKNPASGKFDKNVKLLSKRTVRVGKGRYFRAAFTLAPAADGKTVAKLYLDGSKEAELTISEPLYGYKRVCYIGGSRFLKKGNFKGIIRSAVICSGTLSDEEIAALQ